MADDHEPGTRRLIKVMPEDAEKTALVFDLLPRQSRGADFIAEVGHKYIDFADVS